MHTGADAAASLSDVTPLLEVSDLVTHFRTPRGVVRAVDGVSLSIARGEAIGVVGESGSGKTVLSRSIMGLISDADAVRGGSVRFEGDELLHRSDKQMRATWGRSMAMVFQDPMSSLNPLMRVGEQISEPLRVHLGMRRDDAMATAEKLLADVHIPEPARRLRQYPYELSGGTRQRVMIAIALACGPKLLFADEPTTALDVTVQAQILALIDEQRRERNMAVVLVTHDLGVVANHTDQIIVMYGGIVVERRADAHAVHEHEDALHRGAARQHPVARGAVTHPPADDPRKAPRPRRTAAWVPVRAAVRLRA